MTEAEWHSSHDFDAMLSLVRDSASHRKLRLFACGCCRMSTWLLNLPGAEAAIEWAESWADGDAPRAHVLDAVERIDVASSGPNYDFTHPAVDRGLCSEDPFVALQYTLPWIGTRAARAGRCADLLRCVVGSPFDYQPPEAAVGLVASARRLAQRFLEVAKNLETEPRELYKKERPPHREVHQLSAELRRKARPWLTPDAIGIARQMYESRDFSAMPILADALQDAGCDNVAVLNHCRGNGPHVRGCWVVDLVLGKE